MVSCREATGCICHWATAVFFFVVSSQQEPRAGMVGILPVLEMSVKERGQGEEGRVEGRSLVWMGRDLSCIENSAGKQRILKRRGP